MKIIRQSCTLLYPIPQKLKDLRIENNKSTAQSEISVIEFEIPKLEYLQIEGIINEFLLRNRAIENRFIEITFFYT